MRILVADDHEVVTRGVAAILTARMDIEVCDDAINGKQAVEKARQLNPDMIIMDVSMPVLDGFGAARQIKSFLPNVPILFLSMLDGRQVIEQAKSAGGQGYVRKEEAATVLLEAVDALSRNQDFFPS
jgi:DNA-binding NarL/FixJ family response regulator